LTLIYVQLTNYDVVIKIFKLLLIILRILLSINTVNFDNKQKIYIHILLLLLL